MTVPLFFIIEAVSKPDFETAFLDLVKNRTFHRLLREFVPPIGRKQAQPPRNYR
jgi:hypothetical protein